jgi:hypothetical protein
VNKNSNQFDLISCVRKYLASANTLDSWYRANCFCMIREEYANCVPDDGDSCYYYPIGCCPKLLRSGRCHSALGGSSVTVTQ